MPAVEFIISIQKFDLMCLLAVGRLKKQTIYSVYLAATDLKQ